MKGRFRTKLFSITGASVLALVLFILIDLFTARQVDENIERIQASYVPMLELGPQIEAAFDRVQRELQDAVAAQDRDALFQTKAGKDNLLDLLGRAAPFMAEDEAKRVESAIEVYYQEAVGVSGRMIAGETGEPIIDAIAKMQRSRGQAMAELRRVTVFDRAKLDGAFESVRRANRDADWMRLLIALLSLPLLIGLSLWVSARVLRSLEELSLGFARFGEGDFGQKMRVLSGDELGEAAESANRMAEKLRAATEELKNQTAELDSFSYSVSHDLRAPLRAIDGFSRILLEDYGQTLDTEGQRLLNVVRANTQKMGNLIDDLLAFSRLGRQSVNFQDVDMKALAESAFDEARALEPDRKIVLEVGALPASRGDPSLLKQVWVNLMTNAVKYTRPRETAVIAVEGKKNGVETIYSVRDNGVGFDMKYREKLFGVFQRLHAASEFEGTGVGLALVQRIIKRHGGRVSCEAKLNEGATFSFALPVGGSEHGN